MKHPIIIDSGGRLTKRIEIPDCSNPCWFSCCYSVPNEETIKSLNEKCEGRFKSFDELLESLNK